MAVMHSMDFIVPCSQGYAPQARECIIHIVLTAMPYLLLRTLQLHTITEALLTPPTSTSDAISSIVTQSTSTIPCIIRKYPKVSMHGKTNNRPLKKTQNNKTDV